MKETSWNWLGDHLAVDLVNTVHRNEGVTTELLVDATALAVWFQHERERFPRLPRADHGTLRRLVALRDAALDVIDAAFANRTLPTDQVQFFNKLILGNPMPRLLSCGGQRTAPFQSSTSDPLTDVEAVLANAVVDLLAHDSLHELAFCDAPACGQYFHRKRTNQTWCCPACGDRARVARHAKRLRAAP